MLTYELMFMNYDELANALMCAPDSSIHSMITYLADNGKADLTYEILRKWRPSAIPPIQPIPIPTLCNIVDMVTGLSIYDNYSGTSFCLTHASSSCCPTSPTSHEVDDSTPCTVDPDISIQSNAVPDRACESNVDPNGDTMDFAPVCTAAERNPDAAEPCSQRMKRKWIRIYGETRDKRPIRPKRSGPSYKTVPPPRDYSSKDRATTSAKGRTNREFGHTRTKRPRNAKPGYGIIASSTLIEMNRHGPISRTVVDGMALFAYPAEPPFIKGTTHYRVGNNHYLLLRRPGLQAQRARKIIVRTVKAKTRNPSCRPYHFVGSESSSSEDGEPE